MSSFDISDYQLHQRSFENYLRDVHANQYEGLDDEMSDDFDNWVTDLPIDEVIAYANDWGRKIRNETYN